MKKTAESFCGNLKGIDAFRHYSKSINALFVRFKQYLLVFPAGSMEDHCVFTRPCLVNLHNPKYYLLCNMLDKLIFLRIICTENRRKECMQMRSYDREVYELEMRLMKEISGMKFSLKKLRKIIELDALISCQTNWNAPKPRPQIFRGKGTLRSPRRFIYKKIRVWKYASDINNTRMKIRFWYKSIVFIYTAFSHLLFIFLLQKPQGEKPCGFCIFPAPFKTNPRPQKGSVFCKRSGLFYTILFYLNINAFWILYFYKIELNWTILYCTILYLFILYYT